MDTCSRCPTADAIKAEDWMIGPSLPMAAPEAMLHAAENTFRAAVFREDIGRVAAQRIADHVVGQHLEILVELGLGSRIELYGRRGGTRCV